MVYANCTRLAAIALVAVLLACGDDAAAPDDIADADGGEDGGVDGGGDSGAGGQDDAGADSGADGGGDAASDANGGDTGPTPSCGDGTLNTDEVCEGFELRDATCESEGFSAGRLRCTDNCELDTSGCSRCGDGEITAPEVCEPDDLAGADCAGELGPGYRGELECAPDCTSLVTVGCRPELPASDFHSCDPAVATACSEAAASCVEVSGGHFCLETCELDDSAACGAEGRFCHDHRGQGVCLDVPAAGEVCSERSGCSEPRHQCVPAFDHPNSTEVPICAVPCQATQIGTVGPCASDQMCVPAPGGQVEVQSQTVCTSDQDCDQVAGFRCLPTSDDDTRLCRRPLSLCAEPLPFFAFDGGSTAASVCDREHPSQGLSLCGIGANAAGTGGALAMAVCYPWRAASDRLGVCVGFCDSDVLDTGSDGFCGDGYICAVPPQPEFFLAANEASPVACDPAAPQCSVEEPECVDLGRGPECARPAKMCIPR